MKSVTYSKAAIKVLKRMPRNVAQRVMEKVNQYARDPASQANNTQALKGSDLVRLRVGDWRVIMDDTGIVLAVLKIGSRGNVYE